MNLKTLKEKYTEEELKQAVAIIHGTNEAKKIVKENSKLGNFLLDRNLQESLYAWIEEQAMAEI